MAKVPDEAMSNLQKALNTAASPVYSTDFEQTYRQEQRSASSSKASSRGNSRSGTSSTRPSSNGSSSKSGLSSGWLKNMFTGELMCVYGGSGVICQCVLGEYAAQHRLLGCTQPLQDMGELVQLHQPSHWARCSGA